MAFSTPPAKTAENRVGTRRRALPARRFISKLRILKEKGASLSVFAFIFN